MKKKTRAKLRTKLWVLVSKYMRLKYPKCQICRKNKSSQVHHIMNRKSSSLYFYLDNLIPCCYYCHNILHMREGYSYEEVQKIVIMFIGQEKYDYLLSHRHDIKKWYSYELEQMIQEYRDKIKIIENE